MNSDFRISVCFVDHPKTTALVNAVGPRACEYLLRLFTYCATQSIDGTLPSRGGTQKDAAAQTEAMCRWQGKRGKLFQALLDCGWVDQADGVYTVHAWPEHQPYVVDAADRVERARRAGRASAKSRKKKYGSAHPAANDRTRRSKTPEQPVPEFPNDSFELNPNGPLELNPNGPLEPPPQPNAPCKFTTATAPPFAKKDPPKAPKKAVGGDQ